MAQLLVPVSDQATGSWTNPPLWSKANADDGTDATSEAVGNNTSTSNADLKLASGSTPQAGTQTLRARWHHDQSGRSMQATCELYEGDPAAGGSLVTTLQSAADVGTAEVEDSTTVTGISDYPNLYVRLRGFGNSGGPGRSLHVDLVELSIPDAGAVERNADGSFDAPAHTQSAAAAVEVAADGTFQAAAHTQSGDVAVEVAADGSFSAPAHAMSGTAGAVEANADGTFNTPAHQESGSVSVEVAGDGTFTAPAHTQTGTTTVEAAADGTFNAPAAAMSGTAASDSEVNADGSFTASSPVMSGSVFVEVAGDGSTVAPAHVFAGTVTVVVAADGTYVAAAPVMSGDAGEPVVDPFPLLAVGNAIEPSARGHAEELTALGNAVELSARGGTP